MNPVFRAIAMAVTLSAALPTAEAAPSKTASAPSAAMSAFLDQRMTELRVRLGQSACAVPYVLTGEAHWNGPSNTSHLEENNCRYNHVRESAKRHIWEGRASAMPGTVDQLNAAVEARLRPLASRRFAAYIPYGAHNGHPGYEYLLRDGRTILSITPIVRKPGSGPTVTLELAVFDVRSVPGAAVWARQIEPDWDADLVTFSAKFDPPDLKALRDWGGRHAYGRRIEPQVLTPAASSQIEIDPALQALGVSLAEQRWARLDYMVEGLTPRMNRASAAANREAARIEAFHRRSSARQQAEWRANAANSTPQRNEAAAGAIAGMRSATTSYMVMAQQAARAQQRYERQATAANAQARAGGAPSGGPSGWRSQVAAPMPAPSGTGAASSPTANGGPGVALTRTVSPKPPPPPPPPKAAPAGVETLSVRIQWRTARQFRTCEIALKSVLFSSRANERELRQESCDCREDSLTGTECTVGYSYLGTKEEAARMDALRNRSRPRPTSGAVQR